MSSATQTENIEGVVQGEDLPEGWTLTTLGEVCTLNPPRPPKNFLSAESLVTFVPMPAVDAELGMITAPQAKQYAEVRNGFTSFRDDDVIMAKITPCMENGKAAIARNLANGLGFGSTEFHVLRSTGAVLPEFVYYFIRRECYRKAAEAEMTGSVGQKRVPLSFIASTPIPLPPMREQIRIVEKASALLTDAKASHERLKRKIPSTLRRFKQSVLDSAVTGDLTTEWRAKNRTSSDDDLKRILGAEMCNRNDSEPAEGNEEFKGLLPDEWQATTVGDLFKFIDYRGKTPPKSTAGKRLISAKNIRMGFVSEDPVEFVSNETYSQWMTRGFPKKGDIFFVTEGHTMGFVALNDRDDEFLLAQRTLTLQPWSSVNSRCFLYFMMSTPFQSLIRLNATGSAAVGIKAARFRSLSIPFPPLAEQEAIVERIEALFTLAEKIEDQCSRAEQRIRLLPELILAKAFRGELVANEAELSQLDGRDYESASELLQRIKTQRCSQTSQGRTGRGSASKSMV